MGPKVPVILKISIPPFAFYLKEDWKYKIYVSSPKNWLHEWQASIFGKDYSIKHRTIILLQYLKIGPNYFAGYKHVNLKEYPEAIKRRIEAGRRPKRWRTTKYDPENHIMVKMIEETPTGIRWEVDFSYFAPYLKERIPLREVGEKAMERYEVTEVRELWE